MKIINIFVIASSALLLVACGGRDGLLGVRSVPNEFKSFEHAKIVVPEESAHLPKPRLGAKGLMEVTPREEAQNALR